ncbi:MAG: sensor histidine kinase [Ferruginibacter sp.]
MLASLHNKFLRGLIAVTILLTVALQLQAQQVVNIETGKSTSAITYDKAGWLFDTSGKLSFDEIKNSSFTSVDSNAFAGPEKNYAIWARITLVNNSGRDEDYLLLTNKWGHFEAFIISGNRDTTHAVSGSLLPLHQRSQPSNSNAIKFFIGMEEQKTLYLKFSSEYSIYTHSNINLQLVTQLSFEKNDRQRLLWQGLFFGIILVMALYNLFILFAVKDISYLYYVLSIVSIGLYFAFYYGFGIEYLWPRSPLWDTFCFTIINPFTGLVRILFTRTYLHTPRYLPIINKILNILAAACIATLLTGLGCYLFEVDLLKPFIIVIGVLGALVLIMMLIAGIVSYYVDHYEPAKYFIAANILLVIGAIAFILRETGLMTDNFFTRYLIQYGVLIQAVVLSLGLASRLNKMRLQLTVETLERERLELEKEKEKKELIEKQKKELQQQVKEKTADLQLKNAMLEETVEQLKESENKLSQLNQVKDKLFSVVSHDLRNPLATMQSFLKLITEHREKMSEAEKEKLFFEAQQSLDNLNELLYNLLQWSKSQMNLLQFRRDKLNMRSIIDGAVRLVQLHAHMKQVAIKVSVEEPIPDAQGRQGLTAHADKDMIEFIIRNLLSNAIKFSQRNSEVEIKAFAADNNISIEIIDRGVGLSESKIKKLLEKHTTITRRGTEKEKGTGLGLLISKEFIEKNGGYLKIKSEPGKGSVFSFSVPLYVVKVTS